MITAIDSNILVALWAGTAKASNSASDLLSQAADHGPLVISPVVYAELVAAPGRDGAFVDTFLDGAHIRVDWHLAEEVWRTAASAFQAYSERRRIQVSDPGPRRILADFIIGAHALIGGAALLTFDGRHYRAAFPTLPVVPAE